MIKATALGLIALVMLLTACGDDDDASTDQSTASPTTNGSSTPQPNQDVTDAAGAYLQETGIDDNTGDLTDPLDCVQINDDTEGDFCIHQAASTYALGLAILVVGDADNPDEDAWEMRLTPTDSGWEVTSVQPYGSTE